MGALHLVGGEKGGVGKSFTSRVLSQYFIDSELTFAGFDTDTSHATYSRFYGEYVTPVSVDETLSLDQIIDFAEAMPAANIVVDLAAQTSQKLVRWIEDADLFAVMAELGFQVYLWHVMDDGADSMFLLDKLLSRFQDKPCQLVVVQNYGRGKSYQAFEESACCRLANQRGAKFILLAGLQEDLARKIDFNSLSFWAAANSRDALKIAERHRVNVWLSFIYGQIKRAITEDGTGPAQAAMQSQPERSLREHSLSFP